MFRPPLLDLGARPQRDGRTHFKVWAPRRRTVDVLLAGGGALALQRGDDGYFSGCHDVGVGALYRYRLDGGDAFPDPCSRFQPQGPHGPSEVVDPSAFQWRDAQWRGPIAPSRVIYEVHVGTYTREGTFAALQAQLPELKALGITLLELMPIACFPGRFNWGYDGVSLFAPNATYGRPDDLRRLVDAAHALGLGVILDVVYNHFGPDGNYLAQFSDTAYATKRAKEWGDPPNFDEPGSGGMRQLVVQNACAWVSEYHLDGLRIDAAQNINDDSPLHILSELSQAVRVTANERTLYLVAESERQDWALAKPHEENGHGLDALWVDDFHHCARVAATGSGEAYMSDYEGDARELLACTLRNGLYQGQYYAWQKACRGTPVWHLRSDQIVFALQNHDQVANTPGSERLHQLAGAPRFRALTALWLSMPQTPMLFMGQEFAASAPFRYFVDHEPALQRQVENGRREFLSQFPTAKAQLQRAEAVLPIGEEAFSQSTLDLGERRTHAETYALHRALLALRASESHFYAPAPGALHGAVLSETALVLRWVASDGDWLLVYNLGAELGPKVGSEPLLAPPPESRWQLVLSTEEPRFGGQGAVVCDGRGPWRVQGQCTTIMRSER